MTETYLNDPIADDVTDLDDTPTQRLDRQADDLLARGAEQREFEPTQSLRRAVRDDFGAGRDWARERFIDTRDHIVEEPVKATLYALGVGVLIGLLLRR